MKWQITFYNKKVEQTTLDFPPGILANFLHIAEMIEEYGPALGKPYTAPVAKGLFEIRYQMSRKVLVALYTVWSKEKKLSFCIPLSKNRKKHPRKNWTWQKNV